MPATRRRSAGAMTQPEKTTAAAQKIHQQLQDARRVMADASKLSDNKFRQLCVASGMANLSDLFTPNGALRTRESVIQQMASMADLKEAGTLHAMVGVSVLAASRYSDPGRGLMRLKSTQSKAFLGTLFLLAALGLGYHWKYTARSDLAAQLKAKRHLDLNDDVTQDAVAHHSRPYAGQLRADDPELHQLFSAASHVKDLRQALIARRGLGLLAPGRKVTLEHVIRRDGSLRTSVGEIADAIQAHHAWYRLGEKIVKRVPALLRNVAQTARNVGTEVRSRWNRNRGKGRHNSRRRSAKVHIGDFTLRAPKAASRRSRTRTRSRT
jgi:hypothetical protein